jgi:hypothetical protein
MAAVGRVAEERERGKKKMQVFLLSSIVEQRCDVVVVGCDKICTDPRSFGEGH